MTNRVHYHHPDDEQYSLTYVTGDRESIVDSDGEGIIERHMFDEEFYVLYTNSGASGVIKEEPAAIDEEVIAQLSSDDRVITLRYLRLFKEVVKKKEREEGKPLRMYKERDDDEIPDAINRVDWGSVATDVAGELMSSLILKHPLPNANHRTAISMAGWYLKSTQSGFSLPTLATEDYNWKGWVDEYIVRSKKILTVRRNTTAFEMLQEWGCESIVRKGGIEIDLSEYELGIPTSDAYRRYAKEHTNLCIEFMIESVNRAGYDELSRLEGPTKSQFAAFLQQRE